MFKPRGRCARSIVVMVGLLAGCDTGPKTAEDCLPTLGDHCSCTPKCMTQAEIDKAQKDGTCDLGCDSAAEALDWECVLVDGACAVDET